MALSSGSSAIWSDINAIYTTLRSIQKAHSVSQTAIPADTGKLIARANLNTLNTAATNLHKETHLKNTTYTTVTIPAVGALISPSFITTLRTNINRMNNICHDNCDSCFDCFSSGCSCDGFNDGGGFN